MERRLSSRLACAADRRERRLLQRLRDAAAHVARTSGGRLCLSGRALAASRRHCCAASRATPCRARPSSISCRTTTRSATARLGERLSALAKPEAMEAALAVLLLQPAPPLLFMGEEWGATEPFPFFCDFTGDLARGRARRPQEGIRRRLCQAWRRNSRSARADERATAPCSTGMRATQPSHAAHLALMRELLAAREQYVVPLLPQMTERKARSRFDSGVLTARWPAGGKTLADPRQSVGRRARRSPRGSRMRRRHLGRRAAGQICRRGRSLAAIGGE